MTAFRIASAPDLSEPKAPSTQEAARGRARAADFALLARLRAGDERAFVGLVYQYQPALLRLALIFVVDRAVAEEVVQETWTGVLDGIAHFEGQRRIKPWIFGILIKRARMRVIREARLDDCSADSKDDWGGETAEKLRIEREAIACLKEALQRLPLHLRAVVTLRDIEGLDSGEVRDLLGIDKAIQDARLQGARSRLRRVLDKHLAGVQTVLLRKNAKT